MNILLGVAIALLTFFLITQISNLVLLKKLGAYPRQRTDTLVSILIPARNERDNIIPCLESLIRQSYPNFEILVLDDESSDGTYQLAADFAGQHDRVRVYKGAPLPSGWVGKCWACHQLSQKARGTYYLFTDADTRHHPDMLANALDASLTKRADLLTAVPREQAVSWSEKLTIPLIPWGVFAVIPHAIMAYLPIPLSITVGQFLFFKRGAYHAIGGHRAVSNHATEDMALGRLIKTKGLRWWLVDAGDRVRCRMYRNFHEINEGLGKTLFGAMGYSVAVNLFVCAVLTVAFIIPLPVLGLALLPIAMFKTPLTAALAIIAVAMSLATWLISNLRFSMPFYMAFFFPVTAAISIFVFQRSMMLSMTGHLTWKGRVLTKHKAHW